MVVGGISFITYSTFSLAGGGGAEAHPSFRLEAGLTLDEIRQINPHIHT